MPMLLPRARSSIKSIELSIMSIGALDNYNFTQLNLYFVFQDKGDLRRGIDSFLYSETREGFRSVKVSTLI
jgi:hypothetical protein